MMGTRVLLVDARDPDQAVLHEAGRIIRTGGLVAFPTETVYGLGANALDADAVARIFAAKGRPPDNPLIVHIAATEDIERVARPDEETRRRVTALAQRHWPGPLTVIVPKREEVPEGVTAGLDTVAVRMPDHPVALGLIRAAGVPVAAPSANRSGRPSPTEAAHVLDDLAGRIDMVLDGGVTSIGLESTVLDLSVDPPFVHRPGAVTADQLKETLQIDVHMGKDSAPADGPAPSPGVKYEHYAPRTPCVLYEGAPHAVEIRLKGALARERRAGRRAALLATDEGAARFGHHAAVVCQVGSRGDVHIVAHNIYRCLRQLDQEDVDIIYIEGIAPVGLGEAVMNRLRRASGYRIVHVV